MIRLPVCPYYAPLNHLVSGDLPMFHNHYVPLAAALIPGLIACAISPASEPRTTLASTLMGMPLLFSDDFEENSEGKWAPTDAKAWKIIQQNGNSVYNQFAQSDYTPPVRNPHNRNLIKNIVVGDFVLELLVKSTGKNNAHRDLCFFFGFQDPANLYYVHLGKQADLHANSIFFVNNKPRVSIAQERTDGTPWDDQWHRVRIVRRVESGEILIYFDDMNKPAMKTIHKRFAWGQVGIGSFDDTGYFDEVRLWGNRIDSP